MRMLRDAAGTTNTRRGDCGAAVVDGDDFWTASRYVGRTGSLASCPAAPFGSCDGTRATPANRGSRTSRVGP